MTVLKRRFLTNRYRKSMKIILKSKLKLFIKTLPDGYDPKVIISGKN